MKQDIETLYAKALSEILIEKLSEKQEKTVIENFVNLLASKGYHKKTKRILELTEEIILKKRGNRKIVLQTARKITPKQREGILEFIKKGDLVKEEIDQELVGGIKVIVDDAKQFDFSVKSKLDKLFS